MNATHDDPIDAVLGADTHSQMLWLTLLACTLVVACVSAYTSWSRWPRKDRSDRTPLAVQCQIEINENMVPSDL
jgi:hypothetical protein